jgi:hypothetical protein
MKKILTIAVALCLVISASAQHGRAIAGSRVIIVSPGIGFGYSPFYYSPFGYPFGYPYGYYNNGYRGTSKLQMKIDDLKSDYADKIKSAKKDKSLSKDERNNIVHQLKTERDQAVKDLKANYYKPQKATQNEPDKG